MIPPGEKIVETKKCRFSGKEFFVTDKDLEFYDKVSPVFAGRKCAIPSPTLCPDERMKRRLSFRNTRSIYLRNSDYSGKTIFTIHAPEKPYPVYENDYFYSDKWDPKDYGRIFSDDYTFGAQFLSLTSQVPTYARGVTNLVNSDYCSSANNMKDSYLCFNAGNSEKMLYCSGLKKCANCVDSMGIIESQNLYMCVDLENCYNCFFSTNCNHCRDCWYCDECTGCQDCFCCANLKNKRYCILNQQYTPELFAKKIAEIRSDNQDSVKHMRAWLEQQYKKNLHLLKTDNSIGDYISSAQNAFFCFECSDVQNMRYCDTIKTGKNCMDVTSFGWNTEWCYECTSVGLNAYHVMFCHGSFQDSKDVLYSVFCQSISDCFGCAGLHSHEHHCILNRPYSVSEYEQLCGKIIDHMRSTGEWGEFFPHELSPFGYNETVAQEYFPLTESEVKSRGWNWYNAAEKTFEESSTLVPLSISDFDERTVGFEVAQKNIDTLLAGVVKCEVTGKPFKIIKQELAFYIEHHLPIPTKHPDQRHKERMTLRNPRELHERHCVECGSDIITTYAPDRPEKVVCEECYRKLVY